MGNPAAGIRRLRILCYAAILLSLIAIILSSYSMARPGRIEYVNKTVYIGNSTNTTTKILQYNITGSLITPLYYLPSSPPITVNESFGSRLTGINTQLNASDLSVINNASEAYFEEAGMMYLNRSIADSIVGSTKHVPAFIVNGKPSVIYFGSITCIFCGENRWAMALALSRFGNFSALFKGYSSLGDADVPTLYWAPAHYNQSTVDLGSFYKSKYINFIAIEDTDPITAGFNLQNFGTIQQEINSTGNNVYNAAFSFILNINNFQGTPYTIWGENQLGGADAIDFGNRPPTNNTLPLTYMTHSQILAQLADPTTQFAWAEYAAADLYVAMACGSLGSNAPPICSLPAIRGIEKQNGY